MNRIKYVVDEVGGYIIFPMMVMHSDAAAALRRGTYSSIVGAGFMEIRNDTVYCFGHPESLHIKSRGKEDAEEAKSTSARIREFNATGAKYLIKKTDGEFIVKLRGRPDDTPQTYFTDDADDALATAIHLSK